jgi:hypothetical protein
MEYKRRYPEARVRALSACRLSAYEARAKTDLGDRFPVGAGRRIILLYEAIDDILDVLARDDNASY